MTSTSTPTAECPGDWGRFLEGALARVRIDPVDNPVKYWDYTFALMEARLALRRRERLGYHGYDHATYTERRKIIEAYLQEGHSIVPLVGNDTACTSTWVPNCPGSRSSPRSPPTTHGATRGCGGGTPRTGRCWSSTCSGRCRCASWAER